ncbi:VOC family protein [Bhargavaea beijingensis]|uniref:VOC family protein n=1 Tax=Bhargavaea beijingensis TaxID=426756 RepID=A0ABX9ZFP6_9BACL|nr:VOC family protein [Bhargavaea beijingensis]RSK36523.1 VOC family protein [Bhargavaea beijingensis]
MKECITPYLTFYGRAKEAAVFYSDLFGMENLGIQTYGEADFPTPEGAEEFVIHCHLKRGNFQLMLADSTEPQPEVPVRSISLVIDCDSEEELRRLYNALLDEGRRIMELQETFWGAIYAKVEDRFGFTWDLNYSKDQE